MRKMLASYPSRDLIGIIDRRSGCNLTDHRAGNQSGRVIQPGRCLVVHAGDTLVLPVGVAAATVRGTAPYVLDGQTIRFTSAGIVYEILSFDDRGALIDCYPLTEGSGGGAFSIRRSMLSAGLTGSTAWGLQTTAPSEANLRGYRIAGQVVVPRLADNTGFADDGSNTGGYTGKVAWPAQVCQFPMVTMPSAASQGQIRSLYQVTELNNAQHFSISAWMQSPNSSSDLVSVGVRRSSSRHVSLKLADNTISFYVLNSDGGYAYKGLSNLSPRALHHFVGVFDGTQTGNDARARIYMDGVELTGKAFTVINEIPAVTADMSTAMFGVGLFTSTYDNQGRIFGVRVFSQALNATEVAAVYAGGNPYTPALWWPMREGAGTRVWDVAGSNHGDMTNIASPWANRQDTQGYALSTGWQEYRNGSTYICIPYLMDGSRRYPNHDTVTFGGTTYSWYADHPPITGGINGSPNLDLFRINLCPSYAGVLPAEMSAVYDLVEDRGAGGFPFGDPRDVTISVAELLSLKTTSVDPSLQRRICCRSILDANGAVIGIDRIMAYRRQLTAREWARVLHYQRDRITN
jgi:hypothetical protein